MTDQTILLRALSFAAERHSGQRRKDATKAPYVNHVIAVVTCLAVEGGETDPELLTAAALHDTVEDTDTSFSELEERFGAAVSGLVREVTDDKSLPKAERKRLQVEHAPHLSQRAKRLKIADKICNLRDVSDAPPPNWSIERRRKYLQWAAEVIAGCRGASPALERVFDATFERAAGAVDKRR